MTSLDESRAHLQKAREFLEAARINLDFELLNAATSDAVIAGINSKDAICVRLTGQTSKGDDHLQAVAELKSAGPAGAAVSSTLSRLLKLKTKSQYQTASVSTADAKAAIAWATRLLNEAESVVTAR